MSVSRLSVCQIFVWVIVILSSRTDAVRLRSPSTPLKMSVAAVWCRVRDGATRVRSAPLRRRRVSTHSHTHTHTRFDGSNSYCLCVFQQHSKLCVLLLVKNSIWTTWLWVSVTESNTHTCVREHRLIRRVFQMWTSAQITPGSAGTATASTRTGRSAANVRSATGSTTRGSTVKVLNPSCPVTFTSIHEL